jgi:cytochrome c oxidase subunit 2
MEKRCIIYLLLVFLLLAGCNRQAEQQNVTPTISESPTTSPAESHVEEPTVAEKGVKEEELQTEEKQLSQESIVKEITMTAKKFKFEPSTIKVNKGDKVKIAITSTDVTHGFAIDEYNINERIKPRETVNVEFVADKTGTFTFYCSVYCGSGHGRMKGKLVVE